MNMHRSEFKSEQNFLWRSLPLDFHSHTQCKQFFLPDIEHIYTTEKKSNHVKEKDDIKKMCQCWWEEMLQKLPAEPTKHKQFSRVMVSTDSNSLVKRPAHPVG